MISSARRDSRFFVIRIGIVIEAEARPLSLSLLPIHDLIDGFTPPRTNGADMAMRAREFSRSEVSRPEWILESENVGIPVARDH